MLAGRRLGAAIEEARLLRQIENNLTGAVGVQQLLRFATEAFLATGHLERAERVSQSVRRRAGGRLRQAQSACDLGIVALRQGPESWKRADYFFEEAVRVAREIQARSTLSGALAGRARLFAERGQEKKAASCREEAERIATDVGFRWEFGVA